MPADLGRQRIGMMFIGITPSTGAPRSAPAAAPTHLNGRQLFHGRQMSGGKPAGTRFGGTSGVAEIAENKFYCAVVAPRLHGMPQPPRGSGNCANSPMVLPSRFPGSCYGAKEFPVAEGLFCAISCRVDSEAGRAAGSRRALTLRTLVHRLPALCLSGPFRSELSARSADRGRVVPVLDRSSGWSPIAPFAPSFP
jgi:hypothetical protein